MEHTTFYQYRKPIRGVDRANVDDENYNWDRADAIEHSTQISLAPAYDSSETYNTGDVVMYEFLMYECIDDEVTGTWNPAKWTRTTAGEHGGGSEVEANPQGTPTDDLEKIGINGTIYNIAGSGGGGGNVYGAFIDTNRVIKASTSVASGTTDTYTATEDCAIHIMFVGSTTASRAYIDGVEVETHYASGVAYVTHVLYIRRGQVFSLSSGDNSTNYTVYGLTFGTQNIFTPQIYSTEERCVGVWTDNKPLYQKTFIVENITVSNTYAIDVSALDVDFGMGCKDSSFYFVSGLVRQDMNVMYESGTPNCLYIVTPVSRNIQKGYFTMIYTKTTDIAGGGSFNTLGVPMEHITTDGAEQVVGTYDGETWYERTLHYTEQIEQTRKSYDLTSLQIDKVRLVGAEVKLGENGGGNWFTSPYYYDNNYNMNVSVSKLIMSITSISWNFTEVIATIRYTKTTD